MLYLVKQHCVKSFQIWSLFRSVFSCIRAEYRDLRESFFAEFTEFFQSEYRKIWPSKTPYLDTFHAVKTGQLLSDYIGEIILLFYDGGKGKYIDHRRERDNRKGSKISDTSRKVNYPSFLFPATEATMKQKNSKNGYSRRQNLN